MKLAGTTAVTELWAKIKAYITTKLASYLPLSGGTLTGDLLFSDSGTATRGMYGTVGSNEAWRLIGGASASNDGWMEIATADDGNEPIYVRQYLWRNNNCFGAKARSATLLDASGNTLFPGIVTASAFSGNATSATKATQDASGNDIESTYATKTELSNHTSNVSNPHGVSYTQLAGKISYKGAATVWRKIILSFTTTAASNYSARFDFTYYANNNNSYNSRGDILLSVLFTSSTTWISTLSVTNWYGDVPNFYLIDNGSGSFQFAISNVNGNTWTGFDIYLKHAGGNINTYSYGDQGLTTSGSLMSKSIGTAYTVGALTITKNGTSVGTFNGSANTTIALTDTTSIQPFDFLDSNEQGTFWTQTDTNSIAVVFMTDSKVVTNKVRIFIGSTASAKIRCAIYKKESSVLSLVTQTQLYTGNESYFVDIPFETIATLDSDTLYYFAFESSSSDSVFLGKKINAGVRGGLVYKGDAFNAGSDNFKSQYPMDGFVNGTVFIPYFKIL